LGLTAPTFVSAGDPGNDWDYDAWVKVVALFDAILGGWMANRNVLINGCARVWQRGTSFTSATTPANNDDTYLADHVLLLSDGNDIIDCSQETTTVPTGAYASFKLDVETANKKFGLLFPVEARDAARLIGGNAVASFEARKGGSNATAETLRAAIISWQGTADSITSDVVSAWGAAGTNPTLAANWTYETTPQNLTLTTSFVKFDEDNGLSGAIDTASTKQFALFIWCDDTDATVGDLLYIGNVQVESGLVATDFEHRPFADELIRCQRYFCKSYPYATSPGAASATAGALSFSSGGVGLVYQAFGVTRFPVEMRASPTIVLYNPNDGNTTNAIRDISANADHPAQVVALTGAGGFTPRLNNSAPAASMNLMTTHYTAVAEL
jgi:hypothetical protein